MSFCCFGAFLEKFKETFLLRHKSDTLKNDHWNTQKVCFSYHFWKGANPDENLVMFKKLFWSNQLKEININKNCFSPQSEPHTAKLCLSVVLKHFCGNS